MNRKSRGFEGLLLQVCFCDVAKRGGMEAISERNSLAVRRKSKRTCHPAHSDLPVMSYELTFYVDKVIELMFIRAILALVSLLIEETLHMLWEVGANLLR